MFKKIRKYLSKLDISGIGYNFIIDDLELHERTRKKSEKDVQEKESESPGESQ
jgi:hypothetical protein